MKTCFVLMILALMPVLILGYADKFLFISKEFCELCLAEIKKTGNGAMVLYQCKKKDEKLSDRNYFIVMSNFEFQTEEEKKFSKYKNDSFSSYQKKSSMKGEQRGLDENDIKNVCPSAYMKIKHNFSEK